MTATATLRVGEDAPDFTLPGTDGRDHTLSAYRGKRHVVLAFFPYAFSNTCSAQMPGYQTQLDRFTSANTQVLGISMDSKHSLAAWAAGMGLSFPLLSDFFPQGKVVDLYGVRHPAGMPERALFVIDKGGKIAWIHVHRPTGEVPDSEELFEVLRKLS